MSEGKTRIVFTKHAFQRMREFGITPGKAWWMVGNAEPEKPAHMSQYKQEKYNGNEGVTYWRNGTFVFTVVDKPDGKTGEPIRLVITMTDQRINLVAPKIGEEA